MCIPGTVKLMGASMSRNFVIFSRIVSSLAVMGTATWGYALVAIARSEGIPVMWRFVLAVFVLILAAAVSVFNLIKPKKNLTILMIFMVVFDLIGLFGGIYAKATVSAASLACLSK
jgi:hypothetical protein